jgi:hypothetical protein
MAETVPTLTLEELPHPARSIAMRRRGKRQRPCAMRLLRLLGKQAGFDLRRFMRR